MSHAFTAIASDNIPSTSETINTSVNKITVPLETLETMEQYLNYKNPLDDELELDQKHFHVVVDNNVFLSDLSPIDKLIKINSKSESLRSWSFEPDLKPFLSRLRLPYHPSPSHRPTRIDVVQSVPIPFREWICFVIHKGQDSYPLPERESQGPSYHKNGPKGIKWIHGVEARNKLDPVSSSTNDTSFESTPSFPKMRSWDRPKSKYRIHSHQTFQWRSHYT